MAPASLDNVFLNQYKFEKEKGKLIPGAVQILLGQ